MWKETRLLFLSRPFFYFHFLFLMGKIRIIYEVHNKGLHLKYTGYGEGAERLKGIKAIPTSTLPIFTIQLASDI